jgi:hypothetical protein
MDYKDMPLTGDTLLYSNVKIDEFGGKGRCYRQAGYGLVWIETKRPFFIFCVEENLYRLFYERPRGVTD